MKKPGIVHVGNKWKNLCGTRRMSITRYVQFHSQVKEVTCKKCLLIMTEKPGYYI